MAHDILITGYIGFDSRREAKGQPQNTSEAMARIVADAKAAGATSLAVRIMNCPGGNVSEGLGIHDYLAGCGLPVETYLEGMSASAATLVFQAGTVRRMSANALLLIHRATLRDGGNLHDLAVGIEDLQSIDARQAAVYATRAGGDAAAMLTLMDANAGRGRWLSASDAKVLGLVDEVYEPAGRTPAMAAEQIEDFGLPPVPAQYVAMFAAGAPEQNPQPVQPVKVPAKETDAMKITAAQASALKERFGSDVALAAVTEDLEYVAAVERGAEALAGQLAEAKATIETETTARAAAEASVKDLAEKLAVVEAKLADPLKPSDPKDPPAGDPAPAKPIAEAFGELVNGGTKPAEAWAKLRADRPEDYADHFGMR